jgi:hypothetical protein
MRSSSRVESSSICYCDDASGYFFSQSFRLTRRSLSTNTDIRTCASVSVENVVTVNIDFDVLIFVIAVVKSV